MFFHHRMAGWILAGDFQHGFCLGRIRDKPQHSGQGFAPEIVPPFCRKFPGGYRPPLRPIDFLAACKKLCDHLAKSTQAVKDHQIENRFVLLRQFIAKLIVYQLVQQGVGLGLFEHAKPRVQAGFHRMAPQKRSAKGMDRADSRRIQLAEQIQPMLDFSFRTFNQPIAALFPDAVAHLPGGSLGKGDCHQLSQSGRIGAPRFQMRKESLGKHKRLPAPGPGRKGHRNVPGCQSPCAAGRWVALAEPVAHAGYWVLRRRRPCLLQ